MRSKRAFGHMANLGAIQIEGMRGYQALYSTRCCVEQSMFTLYYKLGLPATKYVTVEGHSSESMTIQCHVHNLEPQNPFSPFRMSPICVSFKFASNKPNKLTNYTAVITLRTQACNCGTLLS